VDSQSVGRLRAAEGVRSAVECRASQACDHGLTSHGVGAPKVVLTINLKPEKDAKRLRNLTSEYQRHGCVSKVSRHCRLISGMIIIAHANSRTDSAIDVGIHRACLRSSCVARPNTQKS
jgi:hypothetical protein